SARFNYELGPPGPTQEMHFAIDQPVPDPAPAVRESVPDPPPNDPTAAEVLLDTKPVRTERVKLRKNRVGVLLTKTFQYQDQLFIHFAVRNHSKKPYAPGTPQVVAVIPGRFRESLHGLPNRQLDEKEAARLKTNGQVPIEVVMRQIRSDRLQPGQETVGVVGIKLSRDHGTPLVLRLVFPSSSAEPVTATLVR
ncbi:MAG: hypothetical protein L0387_16755, partial [Acidobacteria bacterium]|nr:hypothetical protein [Acidobacteriota bacterium]